MATASQLNGLTPNLMVGDVNATIEYYSEVLGFQLMMTVPDSGKFDWAMMQRDAVVLMFQERASLCGEYPVLKDRAPGGGLSLFISVGNVEALYAEVKDKAQICAPLHDTFYGTREFAVLDCNGFVLTFAQR